MKFQFFLVIPNGKVFDRLPIVHQVVLPIWQIEGELAFFIGRLDGIIYHLAVTVPVLNLSDLLSTSLV